MTIVKHTPVKGTHFYTCRYAAPRTIYDLFDRLKSNPAFTFSFAMFQESGDDIGCNTSFTFGSWDEFLDGFESILRGRRFYENVSFLIHGFFQEKDLEINFIDNTGPGGEILLVAETVLDEGKLNELFPGI